MSNVNLIELKKIKTGFLERLVRRLSPVTINFKDNCIDNLSVVRDYKDYLCFDPHAFVLCKNLFPSARPVYFSLELYFKDNHFNLEYSSDIIIKVNAWINTIKGLLIQSEEREQLFRIEYKLTNEIPTFILPVTYLQPSVKEKSSQLRAKYLIPETKKIALHLGGIQAYFSCIELAQEFRKLEGWVLFFHGYYFGDYIHKFKKYLEINTVTNVIISDQVYEQMEDMDPLMMSCDLGIAWYNDVSPNFSTAGKSSGKISAYLRFGLPVIAKKYPSTLEAIEQTGCGICVDDFNEIPDAIRKIEADYQSFSDNCRNKYDAVYWFDKYRENLIEFINR
jgi:glycosyltransferase involved in cell wall biosynthesis